MSTLSNSQTTDNVTLLLKTIFEPPISVIFFMLPILTACDNRDGISPIYEQTIVNPDTQQTACYDNKDELQDCPSKTNSDFFGQDAQYGSSANADTDSRFSLETDESIVYDMETGLHWQRCPDDRSGEQCETRGENDFSEEEAIEYCSTLESATNWRVPTLVELETIVHLGTNQPGDKESAIETDIFPNTPRADFWTLSNSERNTYFINFADGVIGFDTKNPSTRKHLRCVQGKMDSKDQRAELTWQGCISDSSWPELACEKRSWKNALKYCETLDWADESDWRLPNRRELINLLHRIDVAKSNEPDSIEPDENNFAFDSDNNFWSSSTNAAYPSQAWLVSFYDEKVFVDDKQQRHFVRCVRQ